MITVCFFYCDIIYVKLVRMWNMNDEYMNQNLKNPKYLFHGNSLLLKKIETRLSHDSDNNESNIDNAVFVTISFKIASAYAFNNKVKKW